MTIFVLTRCPIGLRGDLTRWLLEIAPGVFVGCISARVREGIWGRVLAAVKEGRAIMVQAAQNEQHLKFSVHQADWQPFDCDGALLIKKPYGTEDSTLVGPVAKGWSNASKYRKMKKFGNQ
ncbi:CRISPR-associated protein Cas2 [Coriobacterium glomerans PW2]|uniref:CRISPR-associated protein Cas2 n=1 Tax=Coriobacterium glomerans (strain ATCC 49209 / DSM 20642 / JCM 10262 / PW2) TaxID=700015 RepID=F2NAL8_CORGP|nr:type I-E CRISPR-associated endoribonuclease Cas2e [Coriobacterium glomerans]AEB06545.1 CRISPR-associated protein Cas2 [Coriobacterium glomerans PW2]